MPKSIPIARFEEANDNHEGWCDECEDFTAEGVEPDAMEYRCPVCREMSVYGAELAMIARKFRLE